MPLGRLMGTGGKTTRSGEGGVSLIAELPVSRERVEEALGDVVGLLSSCEMVGRVEELPGGMLRVTFLPRHLGVRIPHSYTFRVERTRGSLVLRGRALFRAMEIRVQVEPAGRGVRVHLRSVCIGNPLLRRIARKEVHRFLGQLLEAIYLRAGSVRSPPLTTR